MNYIINRVLCRYFIRFMLYKHPNSNKIIILYRNTPYNDIIID